MTTFPASPSSRRPLLAALYVVGTTSYYAMPDLVSTRGRRALAKTAIVAVLGAASLTDVKGSANRAERDSLQQLRENLSDGSPREQRAFAAVAAGFSVLSVGLTVGIEKWLYRRAEQRSTQGEPWAHTRQAVVLGLLAGALSLVPAGTAESDDDDFLRDVVEDEA